MSKGNVQSPTNEFANVTDRLVARIYEVLKHIPAELHHQVVIIGSAALVLNGIDIGRQPADIDLSIGDEVYANLPSEWIDTHREYGSLKTLHGGVAEAAVATMYVSYDNVSILAKHHPALGEHVRIACPLDVYTMKKSMGRPKDIADIEVIMSYL